MTLFDRGGREEAVRHFENAIEITPGYGTALKNLGVVLLRQGRVREARLHFEACLRLDPGWTAARRNLARLR